MSDPNPKPQKKVKKPDKSLKVKLKSEADRPDEKQEIVKIPGSRRGLNVILKGPDAQNLYTQGYYGTPGKDDEIILDPYEASLLLERGRIEVTTKDQKTPLTAQELITYYIYKKKDYWQKYLVYKDLRNRGYPVKLGHGMTVDLRVFPRGSRPGKDAATFFVHIVNENQPTSFLRLHQATTYAKQNKRTLILAIGDRTGDITYYQIEPFKLKKKTLHPKLKEHG